MQNIPPSRIRTLQAWEPGEEECYLNEIKDTSNSNNPLIDLASNDYLSLSSHPELIKAAKNIMTTQGVGAGGSRFITGTRPIHQDLETALSKWLGREKVLLFPSGFQANIAAINALAKRNTPIIADRLIHHSLLVGIKSSGAKLKRFSHNNLEDLERLLKNAAQETIERPLVITESLFSMEGTSPSILDMSKVCIKYKAQLIIDEAHALGVLGVEGKGLCYGIDESIGIISGTFGKAFGSGGAFLATNQQIGEHLIQTSGAFRYTTALAPPLAAASLQALRLIEKNPGWGIALQESSKNWRSKLKAQGWYLPQSNSQILSLLLGSDQSALDLRDKLFKNGILASAIRPPTVPEGTSRLRIILRRNLPALTLEKLMSCIGKA